MRENEVPFRNAVILLVDDDAGDQELTRRALAGDVIKTNLFIVNDGEEAMDYLMRQRSYQNPESSPRPDLILLDLNMPKMNGKQVLEKLRKHHELDSIPVVILTTSKQEEDILRSYKLGCNSFISKPIDIDNFIETVRQLGTYWFKLVALPRKVA